MKPTDEHTYAQLGAFTVQTDLGDFNPNNMDHSYLNDYVFAPKVSMLLLRPYRN